MILGVLVGKIAIGVYPVSNIYIYIYVKFGLSLFVFSKFCYMNLHVNITDKQLEQ